MRTLLLTLSCIVLLGCKNTNPDFVIEGTLPSVKYDGEWIYLVPMKDAPGRVDSFKIVNATFKFSGKGEEIRVLRMRPRLRMELQELLVVTEPGTIQATIDTLGTVRGTPQNDALQHWKEERENSQQATRVAIRELKTASKEDSLSIIQMHDALLLQTQETDFLFLKEQGNSTLGVFMQQMLRRSLSKEQQQKLDEVSQ